MYGFDTKDVAAAHKCAAYLRQNDFYFTNTAKIRGHEKTGRKQIRVFYDIVLCGVYASLQVRIKRPQIKNILPLCHKNIIFAYRKMKIQTIIDMEKRCFILSAAMLVLLTASSCSGSRKAVAGHERTVTYMYGGKPHTDITVVSGHSGERGTRVVPVKEFSSICNSGSANVTLRQGTVCRVEICGNSCAVKEADVSVDNGVLMLKQHSRTCSNTPEYVIYAPGITRIKNRGRLKINMENMDTDNLTVENSGLLSAVFGQVRCSGTFAVNNTGQSEKMVFAGIDAGDVRLDNKGILGTSADNIKCGRLVIDNKGQQKMRGKINSSGMEVSNIGVIDCNVDIEGRSFKLSNAGQADMQATFKGTEVNVSNTGIGRISLGVDCDKLNAGNSGQCDLSISGTADNAVVTGSGIYEIDTRRLNNF